MRLIASLFVFLLSVSALGWTAPQKTTSQETEDRSVFAMEQELRERAWKFALDSLPKAKAERWAKWNPEDPAPEAARDPYDFAYEAFRKGDLVLATGYLQRLLLSEPDYPPAVLLLAMCYQRMDRNKESALCFERVLAAAPQTLNRTVGYARVLVESGRPDDAIAHATRLLKKAPKHARLLALRGTAHLDSKRVEEGWRDLQAAYEIDPKHPFILMGYARCLLEKGQPKAAQEAAQAAVDADPYSPEPWRWLAQSSEAQGNDRVQREATAIARVRLQQLEEIETEIQALRIAWMQRPRDLRKLEQVAALHKKARNLDQAERVLEQCAVWAQEFGDKRAARRAIAGLKDLR